MAKTLKDYKEQGTVRELAPNEKKLYTLFIEATYKDNLEASEFLLVKFPRWSIIAGYYAIDLWLMP